MYNIKHKNCGFHSFYATIIYTLRTHVYKLLSFISITPVLTMPQCDKNIFLATINSVPRYHACLVVEVLHQSLALLLGGLQFVHTLVSGKNGLV